MRGLGRGDSGIILQCAQLGYDIILSNAAFCWCFLLSGWNMSVLGDELHWDFFIYDVVSRSSWMECFIGDHTVRVELSTLLEYFVQRRLVIVISLCLVSTFPMIISLLLWSLYVCVVAVFVSHVVFNGRCSMFCRISVSDLQFWCSSICVGSVHVFIAAKRKSTMYHYEFVSPPNVHICILIMVLFPMYCWHVIICLNWPFNQLD